MNGGLIIQADLPTVLAVTVAEAVVAALDSERRIPPPGDTDGQ